MVAIAYSAGDSFGGSGAGGAGVYADPPDPPACLNHNRIVALIGLAVYENDVDSVGRSLCTGSYHAAFNKEKNHFDGFMARSRSPEGIQGFGAALAAIAMSSDPRIIQIDNPDANQLQRDFGKSLVSCGYAQLPAPANNAPVQPHRC